jgi:hypothetical protein
MLSTRTIAGGAAKVDESPAVVLWAAEDVSGLEVAMSPACGVQDVQPLRHVAQRLQGSALSDDCDVSQGLRRSQQRILS